MGPSMSTPCHYVAYPAGIALEGQSFAGAAFARSCLDHDMYARESLFRRLKGDSFWATAWRQGERMAQVAADTAEKFDELMHTSSA